MKKKKLCIIIGMLVIAVAVNAVTGTQLIDETISSTTSSTNTNRDMWDVQFQYDVGGSTGSLYLVGAGFDGDYFYCPTFNSQTIYRFDKDGTYLDSFTITGVPNLIELTYDGQYFYGQGQSPTNVIYKMDFVNKTLVGTIPSPHAAWNIAYDADNDGFWIGQWQNYLSLIDRTGATITTITPVPESILGMAWDPWTEISGYDGPFLWVFTGTSTGLQGIIKVIDLNTKTLIPSISHNVALELGMGIAGGLELTTDFSAGTATLFGMIQGADPINDYLFGYEIATTNPPPSIPTIPDGPDEGKTGIEYEFTSSTSDPESENIYIKFDWGDGTYSDWIGPEASGSTITGAHTWTSGGTFQVKAKAKDAAGGESDWSAAHEITIEEAVILEIREIGGKIGRVTAIVKNIGTTDATDITYTISLEGGLILLGKESTGTIPILKTGVMADFQSVFIFGFGKPTITVKLEVEDEVFEKTATATVLLFFVLNVA